MDCAMVTKVDNVRTAVLFSLPPNSQVAGLQTSRHDLFAVLQNCERRQKHAEFEFDAALTVSANRHFFDHTMF